MFHLEASPRVNKCGRTWALAVRRKVHAGCSPVGTSGDDHTAKWNQFRKPPSRLTFRLTFKYCDSGNDNPENTIKLLIQHFFFFKYTYRMSQSFQPCASFSRSHPFKSTLFASLTLNSSYEMWDVILIHSHTVHTVFQRDDLLRLECNK